MVVQPGDGGEEDVGDGGEEEEDVGDGGEEDVGDGGEESVAVGEEVGVGEGNIHNPTTHCSDIWQQLQATTIGKSQQHVSVPA